MRSNPSRRRWLAVFVAAILGMWVVLASAQAVVPEPTIDDILDIQIDQGRADYLASGGLMVALYQRMVERGVTEYMGKDLTQTASSSTSSTPRAAPVSAWGANVHVDGQVDFPFEFGANEPAIDVSPLDPNFLIAAFHDERGFAADESSFKAVRVACSFDGGSTWTTPAFSDPGLPGHPRGRTGNGFPDTFDPSVRFGPDGRAYIAYASLDWKDQRNKGVVDGPEVLTSVLVVTTSDCVHFRDRSVVVSDRANISPFPFHDKPFIEADRMVGGRAYVSWTEFSDLIKIRVRSTTNGGRSWTDPVVPAGGVLDAASGSPRVIQGSYPASGPGLGGNPAAYVCWYDSTTDGWLVASFKVRCARSDDGGQNYGASVVAANITPGLLLTGMTELDFFDGPSSLFARKWGSMFPRPTVRQNDGSIHIVTAAQPATNLINEGFDDDPFDCDPGEDCGEILYVASTDFGASWTPPISLTADDPGSPIDQDYPAIACQADGACHVIFNDMRAHPGINDLYDVAYTSNPDAPAGAWSPSVLITDATSVNDFVFRGDYIDITASAGAVHGIWTDRRDRSDIFDFADHVFTAKGT